jgi:hypothetical protein
MSRAILLERLDITEQQLADFCRRWRITELALFGSVLREDAVTLVSRRAIERSGNWIRRREILESAQVVHAAP